MYLSLATTHRPATDLGFLLHKHPARLHEIALSFGRAFVFYPEASEERCEVALVVDVDPVALVRGKGGADGLHSHYVNDRPYAASSFLCVAMARALGTALAGSAKDRPELAATAIPLEATVTPLRGNAQLVQELFEPLGWTTTAERIGGPDTTDVASGYLTVRLSGIARLQSLLSHLYVLIPVLDDDKHYWVGEDEVAKLLKRGEGWIENHPSRETIVRRYLDHRRALVREALERLAPETRVETTEPQGALPEEVLETPLRLADQRLDAVVDVLKKAGARTVADIGCGEGRLLDRLVRERWVDHLVGVDAAARQLHWAAKRLKISLPGGPPEGRVQLLHGSLTYRDKRWEGVDAVTLVEVIEHLGEDRLSVLGKIVFGMARPATVVVTTPNSEYNVLFANLGTGAFRHPDHRFEWTRGQFQTWAEKAAATYGYTVKFSEIGQSDERLGPPTQMAVFTLGAK
ncbi:MAG: 3' terminal RNA ribose 2'-O-methyltransferase Hen1 [Alphaproteobacteria bacterium]|nr:3' terminal RNA ribose 2'-O-methyltransferase Hen1 [Alphaproteobacteria bacterium]